MTSTSTPTLVHQAARTQIMRGSDNIWGRRTSILPSLSFKKSSNIEILLDGNDEFIRSYSTFDEITGCVNITFEKDTAIDDLAITFQGQTNTWVEKVATASPTMGRTTGRHTFMRIQQPIDTNYLPEYNKALAGQTYSIPFTFVVPDRVLDFVCSHSVEADHVRDCHLQLPPSIGDAMLSGQGNTLMDDLAPNMAKVSYSIRVGLLKACPNHRKPDILEESVGVRIIPAREEAPPLAFENRFANHYRLRKEKIVRKGIFKIGKRQGTLTAESFQPPSFQLSHPSKYSDVPVTTNVVVQLRYDPVSLDEQPPSLTQISSKLKCSTFFGASPWAYIPAPDGYDIHSIIHSQYPQTVELATRNLSSVQWQKHEPGSASAPASPPSNVALSNASKSNNNGVSASYSPQANALHRHDSTFTSASSTSTTSTNDSTPSLASGSVTSAELNERARNIIISPSSSYDGKLPHYTASVIVPTTLPMPKPPCNSSTTSPDQSRRPSSASFTQSRRASTTTFGSSSTNSNSKPKPKPSKPQGGTKQISWLPTFHSCLISRIYSLELGIHALGAPTVNLRLPVQISVPLFRDPPASPLVDQPAFFDPFATENEEVIARALGSSAIRGSIPDYEEDDYNPLGGDELGERISCGRRIMISEPEAPPEYFSAVRQLSATRRSAVPENERRGSDVNSEAPAAVRNSSLSANHGGVPSRRSNGPGRRVSVLTGL